MIDAALNKVRFPIKIDYRKARILHYCVDLFNKLEGVGYCKLLDENPKHIFHLLLKTVEPRPEIGYAKEDQGGSCP